MKNFKSLFLATALVTLAMSCTNDDKPKYLPPTAPSPPEGEVVGSAQIWVTNGSESKLLSKQEDLVIIDNVETSNPSITIDPTQRFQELDGFGAALTGSSAFLINRMDNASKNALLSELFHVENGIGISYLRMSIGASDFSLSNFTYNDIPAGAEDPDLINFSIAEDEKEVVPVFKSILQIAPEIKIMGSPWSAPAWMKDSQSLNGGNLRPEWYDVYAEYFIKYIEAYAAHGIGIDAITPQNEPLHEAGYPTMRMEASAQADFIKNSLGPAFEENDLRTKIISYDHNFDRADYPIYIYEDAEASKYVDGAAFHAYAGDVSAMSAVHNAFPEKNLYFTEISGGEWATSFEDNLIWNTKNITMGATKNWSKNVVFWNLALNENYGPTNNGCQDCRGVVTITSSNQIEKNVEYYAIGHFSKFVRPGAYRIGSTDFASSTGLGNVAFENIDGSKVLVVLNESSSERNFSVIIDGNSFTAQIDPRAVVSIVWE